MAEILDEAHNINNSCFKIIAIGISTGGPKALHEIIPMMPANFPAAVLIVQHMPAKFTKSLADRLNALSNIEVKEAEAGDIVQPGIVYIAPGGLNMFIKRLSNNELMIGLSSNSMEELHKPSVNVLLDSLAKAKVGNLICVIMTGMGSDGSKGIISIKKNKNVFVIAQDEQSSVVFGMPKAAIMTGLVDEVLSLKEIVSALINTLGVNE